MSTYKFTKIMKEDFYNTVIDYIDEEKNELVKKIAPPRINLTIPGAGRFTISNPNSFVGSGNLMLLNNHLLEDFVEIKGADYKVTFVKLPTLIDEDGKEIKPNLRKLTYQSYLEYVSWFTKIFIIKAVLKGKTSLGFDETRRQVLHTYYNNIKNRTIVPEHLDFNISDPYRFLLMLSYSIFYETLRTVYVNRFLEFTSFNTMTSTNIEDLEKACFLNKNKYGIWGEFAIDCLEFIYSNYLDGNYKIIDNKTLNGKSLIGDVNNDKFIDYYRDICNYLITVTGNKMINKKQLLDLNVMISKTIYYKKILKQLDIAKEMDCMMSNEISYSKIIESLNIEKERVKKDNTYKDREKVIYEYTFLILENLFKTYQNRIEEFQNNKTVNIITPRDFLGLHSSQVISSTSDLLGLDKLIKTSFGKDYINLNFAQDFLNSGFINSTLEYNCNRVKSVITIPIVDANKFQLVHYFNFLRVYNSMRQYTTRSIKDVQNSHENLIVYITEIAKILEYLLEINDKSLIILLADKFFLNSQLQLLNGVLANFKNFLENPQQTPNPEIFNQLNIVFKLFIDIVDSKINRTNIEIFKLIFQKASILQNYTTYFDYEEEHRSTGLSFITNHLFPQVEKVKQKSFKFQSFGYSIELATFKTFNSIDPIAQNIINRYNYNITNFNNFLNSTQNQAHKKDLMDTNTYSELVITIKIPVLHNKLSLFDIQGRDLDEIYS